MLSECGFDLIFQRSYPSSALMLPCIDMDDPYRNTFTEIYTEKGYLQVESFQSCKLYTHEHICEN